MLSLTELSWYDKNGKLQNILDFVYPVGSIYMTTNNQDPSTLFGGEWVSWGSGRVPVGVSADVNDRDFGTVEKTGGEREHQLITSEMPSHRHKGHSTHTYTNIDHAQKPFDPPPFDIQVSQGTREVEVQYKVTKDDVSIVSCRTMGSGQTTEIVYSEKVTSAYGVANEGGDIPHNNLQPYITCYMWKRTA